MGDTLTFSLIPELTSEIFKKVGFEIKDISASYRYSDEIRNLEIHRDATIGFEDPKSTWSIEEYGLILEIDFRIKKPRLLFDENRLASPGDILKIAFRISSQDSHQRLVFGKYGFTIVQSSESMDQSMKIDIPPGKLRKTAYLEMLMYLSKSSNPDCNYKPGTILGIMYHTVLSFSGDGSEFPINTLRSDENFLWKLEMDYEDPRTDRFDQSVMLWLNAKHPKYKNLDMDSDPASNVGFMEIMVQATFLVISEMLKTDVISDIVTGTNLEPGSLGEATHYMIMSYAPNYNNPIELTNDLHRMIWDTEVT